MASHCLTKLSLIILITSFAISSLVSASLQFEVGGEQGWIKPNKNQTHSYNQWASKNRFHVGDSLHFKYKNDSVLVVNYTSYIDCVVSNPIEKYEDGDTMFRFDRFGYFYFISGKPGHCKAGQKLDVRVMVHSVSMSPEPAAAAESPERGTGDDGSDDDGDGWDFGWGSTPMNSTIRLSLASYFMTALVGVLVILYLLM